MTVVTIVVTAPDTHAFTPGGQLVTVFVIVAVNVVVSVGDGVTGPPVERIMVVELVK